MENGRKEKAYFVDVDSVSEEDKECLNSTVLSLRVSSPPFAELDARLSGRFIYLHNGDHIILARSDQRY